MLLTNPLVSQFTSLNEGNLPARVELPRNGNNQERGHSFRGMEPSSGIADDRRKVFLYLDLLKENDQRFPDGRFDKLTSSAFAYSASAMVARTRLAMA